MCTGDTRGTDSPVCNRSLWSASTSSKRPHPLHQAPPLQGPPFQHHHTGTTCPEQEPLGATLKPGLNHSAPHNCAGEAKSPQNTPPGRAPDNKANTTDFPNQSRVTISGERRGCRDRMGQTGHRTDATRSLCRGRQRQCRSVTRVKSEGQAGAVAH